METKPAWYTTEFWVSVILVLFMVVNLVDLANYMPDKWSALVIAVITAAYTVSRGIAKNGVSADPTVPGNFKLVPTRRDARPRP